MGRGHESEESMRLILSVILGLYFFTSVYPLAGWESRDDYYRENVHSEYYDLYYSHHYDNYRAGYEDWNWGDDYWDRETVRMQDEMDEWWDEDYKDYLEEQGVDRGLMMGW
jgi:hypothetical protein